MKRIFHRSYPQVVLMALVLATMLCGCVIRIGQGGTDDTSGDDVTGGQGSGGSGGVAAAGGGGDSEDLSQEDIDTANALFAEHPEEVALGTLRASYVALALSNLVFDGSTDPNDTATVEALVEQYTPQAIEQADLWIAGLDASMLQEAIGLGYAYPVECIYEPYSCSSKLLNCPWLGEDHICYLSECGIGKCSFCPLPFPIAVRSWCIHNCFRIGDGSHVGSAVFITLVGGARLGPICVPK